MSQAKEQVAASNHGESRSIVSQSGLQPGDVLAARYEIKRELGRGGYGHTYIAVDLHSEGVKSRGAPSRLCVVKQLIQRSPDDANERRMLVERVAREVAALMSLNEPGNPHIPDIYDYIPDHFCLVMKYIDGQTLDEMILKRKRLSTREALRYAEEALDTLIYLHYRQDAQGQSYAIVHRDITPRNLMVGAGRRLWVLDFGIAQGVALAEELIDIIAGSRGYMPPEQLQGQPEPRSDVYALGMTLYTLLTGRDPSTLSLKTEPTKAGQAGDVPAFKGIKGDLQRIIARAISPDVAERPTSRTLREEIRQIRTIHRQRTQSWLLLALLLFVALLGLFGFIPGVGRNIIEEYAANASQSELVNDKVQATLSPLDPLHHWTFDGVAGEYMIITAAPTFGQHTDPKIALRGPKPSSAIVAGAGYALPEGSSRIALNIPDDGLYTVEVEATSWNGGYELTLETDEQKSQRREEVFTSSFTGRAEDEVTVTCAPDEGSNAKQQPEIQILDSSDQPVPPKETIANGNNYVLPHKGSYNVSITDFDGSLDRCALQLPETSVSNVVGTIGVGETKKGKISEVFLFEDWTFTPTTSGSITMSCESFGTSLGKCLLQVIDSDGKVVSPEAYDYTGVTIDVQSGRSYTIRVAGTTEFSGPYRLTVKR